MASQITLEFMTYARRRFRLDWQGIHGARHWARVRRNGLEIAKHYKVDEAVIEWFAFIHDLERFDEHTDPFHGYRAAELVPMLNDRFMALDAAQMEMLSLACEGHSGGEVEASPTVMVCWDADRLDLSRVGIEPDPRYLCTGVARSPAFIDRCVQRSFA